MKEFTHSLTINAPPAVVLDAFFNQEALAAWWNVTRSLCVPRPLGVYAVEWDTTEWRDEVLGRLGGAFKGTVIEFKAGREFFIADAYWLPPDGEPIGPMAFEVTCSLVSVNTVLHVRQSGFEEDSKRWSRYYDIISTGLTVALDKLKKHVEGRWSG
jgi:uncharacterized protein YndB with AHSA1/START domain